MTTERPPQAARPGWLAGPLYGALVLAGGYLLLAALTVVAWPAWWIVTTVWRAL